MGYTADKEEFACPNSIQCTRREGKDYNTDAIGLLDLTEDDFYCITFILLAMLETK